MSLPSHSVYLPDAEHTRAAGYALGQALTRYQVAQPLVIALNGELGAGKTTFVGGLLNALGYIGTVRSPTYTLIEPYEFSCDSDVLTVFHLDLYRLTDPAQLEELGFRDLLQPNAVLLIEWAERAGNALAEPDLAINLAYTTATAGRDLMLVPTTAVAAQLIHSMHDYLGTR